MLYLPAWAGLARTSPRDRQGGMAATGGGMGWVPSTQRARRGRVLSAESLDHLLPLRGELCSSPSSGFSSAGHTAAPVSPGVGKRYQFNTNN